MNRSSTVLPRTVEISALEVFDHRQGQLDDALAELGDWSDQRGAQTFLLGALIAGVDEATWQRSLCMTRDHYRKLPDTRQPVDGGVRHG